MKEFFAKFGAAVRAHKGRTVAICVTAFVLICAIVTLSCLGAFVFNRFATGYVPTDEDLALINNNVANQYDRVVIIGVDGTGKYPGEMLDDDPYSLPNFKKVFVDGFTTAGGTRLNASVTYSGIAVYPTISAQNWTSMFRGVRPPYHGITGSSSNKDLSNGKQPNEKYPSFIKVFLDANPTAKVFSSCTWDAVNNGAIEDLANVVKYNTTCEDVYKIANDEEIEGLADPDTKEFIKNATEGNSTADPDYFLRDMITVQRVIEATTSAEGKSAYKIAYMHLNQVDSAGHSYGYNKHAYARAVARVDDLIGRIYDAYEAEGMLDNTLFIYCTDHGHRYLQDGTGHGGNSNVEVKVTFAIAGKTVKQGTSGKYVNTDLAPIVAYALGVKAADSWQGRVPYGMFTLLG
ncbi:MAG: alkaline phosphatase family protein [Clostridia bacterium]|nr:alkaline phosphatase family protein [Clostridia bacterium]